jgi:biotin operon repressor
MNGRVSRSGYDEGEMADEGTLEDRFLRELYGLADGRAERIVSGEELARRLGMDPDSETGKARFLGTARRLEEEGYVIANKTGPEVRNYSSLSLTHAGIRAVE